MAIGPLLSEMTARRASSLLLRLVVPVMRRRVVVEGVSDSGVEDGAYIHEPRLVKVEAERCAIVRHRWHIDSQLPLDFLDQVDPLFEVEFLPLLDDQVTDSGHLLRDVGTTACGGVLR